MRMLSFPDLAEHRAICLRAFIVTERVTLITGASAGIGAELARIFASNGHRVALVARRAERLAALAGEITANGGGRPRFGCPRSPNTPAPRHKLPGPAPLEGGGPS